MFYSVVPFYTRVRSYSTRTLLFRDSIFDAGTLLLQRHSYLIGESNRHRKYVIFFSDWTANCNVSPIGQSFLYNQDTASF